MNVSHFVTDYDIYFRDKFREEVDGEFKDEWWVPFQRKLLGIDDTNVPIIRLYLNVVMMAEYKTSPRDIAIAIARGNNSERVKCVFSPANEGIIDIYPTIEALNSVHQARNTSEEDTQFYYIYFLDQNIKQALKTSFTIVRGYESIEALYYSYTPVMSALTFCQYLSDRSKKGKKHYFLVKKK